MSQGPGKAKRGLPSKEENFNEWYPFIVEAAELSSINGTQSKVWMYGGPTVGKQ